MHLLARNWWAMLLRGVAAIVFGLLAIAWPGITFGVLVLLFGAFALVDGIFAVAAAIRRSRAQERWGVLLFEGIVGIAAGIVAFTWPALTALAIVTVIAAWALITGVLEIAAAIRLRKHVTGEWRLVLSGILSLILGALLFARPVAGALAIALVLGIYAVIFGALEIALAYRLRSWGRTAPEAEALRPAA